MPENITLHSTAAQRAEWGRRAAERTAARHVDVDPAQITFGVEIECYIPANAFAFNGIQRGQYHGGIGLASGYGWPTGWKASADGSLNNPPMGYTGVEFVSPVLRGIAGLRSLKVVLDKLNALNVGGGQTAAAKANSTCGCHVHIGMPSVLGGRSSDWELIRSWVVRLVGLVSKHEMALIAIGGTTTRINNHYCQSIKDNWNGFHVWSKPQTFRARAMGRDAGRYRVLNMQHLFDEKQTVEFRVFAGTVNPTKVMGYVLTAIALCHKAADKPRAIKFDPVNYSLRQLRELAITPMVAALQAEVAEHGMTYTTVAEVVSREQVRTNQDWNTAKFERELRGIPPQAGGQD